MEDDDWDAVLDTNLDGFYNVLRPVVMPMVSARKGGRIVTLSSVSGLTGNRGQVNYSAAKAGIIGATKALSIELAKRAITVNCVAPGIIETRMTADLPVEEIVRMIPMRRIGRPEDVAGVVAFLLLGRSGVHHPSGHLGERGHDLTERRVVVTGMAGVTALGEDWPTIRAPSPPAGPACASCPSGRASAASIPGWPRRSPTSRSGDRYPRKKTRTMGRVSQLAVYATERALADAGLLDEPVLHERPDRAWPTARPSAARMPFWASTS